MLVDTDVIIWFMRGNERAARALEDAGRFSISAVTYMELVQGMRNKSELRQLRRALSEWRSPILPIDESVSDHAMLYVEQHFHRSALRLADALIGASAIVHGLPLLTANVRHYRVLSDLELKQFKP